MDFEQQPQEFEVEESGAIIINGARKEAYKKFFKNFQEGKGTPTQFFGIFGKLIEDCGFNLRNQEPAIKDTIFIRGLKDILPVAGTYWTLWSDLDFKCNSNSVDIDCFLSIEGTKVKKEKTDELLRLVLMVGYPQIIKLIPAEKGYRISVTDYSVIKTSLILISRMISATNDIIFLLSDSFIRLVRDMQKKENFPKEFLDNLV